LVKNQSVFEVLQNNTQFQLIEESHFSDEIRLERRDGKPSIFAEAWTGTYQYLSRSPKNAKKQTSPVFDPYFRPVEQGPPIKLKYSTLLHAHSNCENLLESGRPITEKDRTVKIREDLFYSLFAQRLNWSTFFNYELTNESTLTKSQIKAKVRDLFKQHKNEINLFMKERFFLNQAFVKLENCLYREKGSCTIYLLPFEDAFVIVDSENTIIDYGLYNKYEYIDIYVTRSLLTKTNMSLHASYNETQREPLLFDYLQPSEIEKRAIKYFKELHSYSSLLEDNRLTVPGSFYSQFLKEKYRLISFNLELYEKLRIVNEKSQSWSMTEELEAMTLVGGVHKGWLTNPTCLLPLSRFYQELDFDFKIDDCDHTIFTDVKMKPGQIIYGDLKTPKSPEILTLGDDMPRSVESQAFDIVKSVLNQKARANEYNVIVIHVIQLLQLTAEEQKRFIVSFLAYSKEQNLNLNNVKMFVGENLVTDVE